MHICRDIQATALPELPFRVSGRRFRLLLPAG